MGHAPFAAEMLHHEQRNGCTISNGHDAPRPAVSLHHPPRRIQVISRKQLKERTADIYLCMYHYTHRDVCPRTHRVYHDMLYPYVLQEIQAFARSMKRRKVNSPIKDYANIQELTPEILDATIERIEISHVNYHSKPGSVIHIYWKLK